MIDFRHQARSFFYFLGLNEVRERERERERREREKERLREPARDNKRETARQRER
jgi:hypothetical protein